MGPEITQWEWNNFQEIFPAWLVYCWFQLLLIMPSLWSVSFNPSLMYTRGSFLMLLIVLCAITGAEGAFKKLKPEPQSLLGSGGPSPPSAPQHAGHTPTTASCPTPARRRHRTTFTQVYRVRVRVTLRPPVSRSVSLGVEPRLGLMTRCYVHDSYWRVVGSVICHCLCQSTVNRQ
jgi:hypothetical protein